MSHTLFYMCNGDIIPHLHLFFAQTSNAKYAQVRQSDANPGRCELRIVAVLSLSAVHVRPYPASAWHMRPNSDELW